MLLSAYVASLASPPSAWPEPISGAVVVVRGASPTARLDVAGRVLMRLAADAPASALVPTAASHLWPFEAAGGVPPTWPAEGPAIAWVPDMHEAFVNAQGNATRLVTTQPLYALDLWRTAIERTPGRRLVATADPAQLDAHAPEVQAGRGAWRDVQWIDAPADAAAPPSSRDWAGLAGAFRSVDPAARLAAAGEALDRARTPIHMVVMASVCMEVNDLDNAGRLLADAVRADPAWGAAQFELGKYWLRRDDMTAAADAFGAATRLLPRFASAAANWGATLGELDQPEPALDAFRRVLEADPDNPQGHNNLGVVLRELGRLGDSEAAFRRVIALTPALAFGHYNLGHTLFLQGRYQASLAAYQAGQRQDPARSPVQASRLALARLASGDADGALRDLQGCTAALPRDYRRQVLADTQSVAWALLSAAPELRGWRIVGDWLATELSKA